MSPRIGKRHELVMQSEIRNMSIECDSIGGVNLSQGVCDTEVPIEVRKSAQKAIDRGINTYTRYDGLEELRKAIASKQKRFTGIEFDYETEVIVSAGATGALYCACMALLNRGDEVIVFEPYYGYHIQTLLAAQTVPVYVRMDPNGWKFSDKDLERVKTSRTKAILINTPANPSGKIFSKSELINIATFAEKYDLFILTDEIYEHFVYDDFVHISPASIMNAKQRTITISGLSKTFSITGWRVGYVLCSSTWAQLIGYFNDLVYVCAPAPLQVGVAAGLNSLDNRFYDKLTTEYHNKRTLICDTLEKVGLSPYIPQGAYYVLADISRLPGENSKDRAMYLLSKTGVACVPGDAFYHDNSGKSLARFCFAKKESELLEACERISSLKC